jgi:Tol biopolymer transport system component
VWLIEVGRGVPSRFTFDASADGEPLWSPDGRRVVLRSARSGVMDLFEKPASGAADEQSLLVTAEPKTPLAWSPDGRSAELVRIDVCLTAESDKQRAVAK